MIQVCCKLYSVVPERTVAVKFNEQDYRHYAGVRIKSLCREAICITRHAQHAPVVTLGTLNCTQLPDILALKATCIFVLV